jgi:chromosome partitioning protein
MAHIIVLGNEKGGSGKSTTAMHIMAALTRSGHKTGAIDLDLRQKSLFRYLDNRQSFIDRKGVTLPMPARGELEAATDDSAAQAQDQEQDRFSSTISRLEETCDFIIIDCPGAHTRYSQMAHSIADTLITPMNDSLIDFDLLARLNPADGAILGPSVYSEMVWKARQRRAEAGHPPIDWLVLRNRLASLDAKNKRRVAAALNDLSKRIGFRIAPGFTERVVFREMFLSGLTLLDLKEDDGQRLNMSNLAAKQEVRELMKTLDLPDVEINF